MYTGEYVMTPDRRATVRRNMVRAAEFMRYIVENPAELDKIPSGSSIMFDDDPELKEKLSTQGNVVCVKKVYEYH